MPHDHDHTDPPSNLELRVKALESLLVEKGLVDPAALDALIDTYENKVGPRNGAKVIAKAWSGSDYKAPVCWTMPQRRLPPLVLPDGRAST